VKALHSICQQMWKTQQWPQDWKRSVFIPIPKKGNAKECSNYYAISLILHTSKVMLKIPLVFSPTLYPTESRSVVSDSLQPHRLYSPLNSPGQNTRVGSLSLLQGIFPTHGSNPGLLHCRQILYQLSHKGSPRIVEWVAYPFSSRSSRPRNQTRVSCIAGGFLSN